MRIDIKLDQKMHDKQQQALISVEIKSNILKLMFMSVKKKSERIKFCCTLLKSEIKSSGRE